MFLLVVGLVVALLLSCVDGAGLPPPPWPLDTTIPWYKCNHPGTEETSEQFGQTVRSFRHCLNEDQIFKNSYCDRDVSPQAIHVRCMNKTMLPNPSYHDFDWWNAKCNDDEVCVDDDGLITWPSKESGDRDLDSIARCVKPADTAVLWSTNNAKGKHRARWSMIGQDVNYTREDYNVAVHFLKNDFRTPAQMRNADFSILDARGEGLRGHTLYHYGNIYSGVPYIAFTKLWRGWRQFEVEFQYPPKSYGLAFTIVDKVAA